MSDEVATGDAISGSGGDADIIREDVWFGPVDEQCAAWLYRPAGDVPAGGTPCVVMANGFSMTRRTGLTAYAERFARAGYATLIFDYRCFGDSQGVPRQRFRIPMQLDDWSRAVELARGRPGIDPARIALWGYSFSGGHVTTLLGRGEDAACAMVMAPFVNGLPRVLKTKPSVSAWIIPRAVADLAGRHTTIPVTGPDGSRAAMTLPGEGEGFARATAGDPTWINRISPGVFLTVGLHKPLSHARRISVPLWVGLGLHDITVHGPSIRRLAKRAPSGELHRYPYDHFDPMVGSHIDRVAVDQLDFLDRTLGAP